MVYVCTVYMKMFQKLGIYYVKLEINTRQQTNKKKKCSLSGNDMK